MFGILSCQFQANTSSFDVTLYHNIYVLCEILSTRFQVTIPGLSDNPKSTHMLIIIRRETFVAPKNKKTPHLMQTLKHIHMMQTHLISVRVPIG